MKFAIALVLGILLGGVLSYVLVQQRAIPLVGAVVIKPSDLRNQPIDPALRRSFESLRQ